MWAFAYLVSQEVERTIASLLSAPPPCPPPAHGALRSTVHYGIPHPLSPPPPSRGAPAPFLPFSAKDCRRALPWSTRAALPHTQFLSLSRAGDQFFRVDESFRAGTRAGLTRARSLNTCFIGTKRGKKKLTSLMPSSNGLCALRKFVEGKRISLERLLSGKNTLISPLRSQDALKPPLP